MDSSAKYRRFPTHRKENENEKRDSKKKLSSVAVFILVLVVFAVVAALAIGIGVGVSQSQANTLTIMTASPEELQGKYHNSIYGGIFFGTAVNDSFVYLSITTVNGEPVIHILHSVKSSMTMIGVNKTYFLIMENQPEYADYVIPTNYINLLETMIMEEETMTDELIEQLDNTTVTEIRQSSLASLAVSQAALLIIEAAREFENQDSDIPALGPFYLLAVQLSKVRHYITAGVINSSSPDDKATKEPGQTETSNTCGSANGGGICGAGQACPSKNDDCLGLCGAECSCWKCVCGNCCINEFCLTHDKCCRKTHGFWGYLHPRCWSVIWRYPRVLLCPFSNQALSTSTCSQPYTC